MAFGGNRRDSLTSESAARSMWASPDRCANDTNACASRRFHFRSGESHLHGFRRESKGFACKRISGLQHVGESRPLRQYINARASGHFFFQEWRKPPAWLQTGSPDGFTRSCCTNIQGLTTTAHSKLFCDSQTAAWLSITLPIRPAVIHC